VINEGKRDVRNVYGGKKKYTQHLARKPDEGYKLEGAGYKDVGGFSWPMRA
jgi:hypothetical protein